MKIKKGKIKVGRGVNRQNRALRSLRNGIIAFFVLLVLLVGGAILYVWLGTDEAPSATIAEPSTTGRFEKETEYELDPNSPVGVSVQTVTSPAIPGNNVSLSARTRPDATCKIVVEYNKIPSTDSGLREKTADRYGIVTWSWALEENTPVGKWPITITCTYGENSGIFVKDFIVGEIE